MRPAASWGRIPCGQWPVSAGGQRFRFQDCRHRLTTGRYRFFLMLLTEQFRAVIADNRSEIADLFTEGRCWHCRARPV